MNKRKDLVVLFINTILLAVIATSSVLTLRTMRHDQHEHRLRNESENICQLEALSIPAAQRPAMDVWLKIYDDCVFRRSGGIPSPIKP